MINQNTIFTHIALLFQYYEPHIYAAYLFNGKPPASHPNPNDAVAHLSASEADPHEPYHFDLSDTEVLEVLRRVKNGTCKVVYYDGQKKIAESDLTHEFIDAHPFHKNNQHLILDRIVRDGGYTPATENSPAEFHIPGIVRDQTYEPMKHIHVYKWSENRQYGTAAEYQGDEAAFLQALNDDGWYQALPFGTGKLYVMRVGYGTNRLGAPCMVNSHPEEKSNNKVFASAVNRVKAIARTYYAWELAAPAASNELQRNVREWWRTWIGFAWEKANQDPVDNIEIIKPALGSDTTTETLTNDDDTINWIVTPLEEWAIQGIDHFADTVNDGILSSLLDSAGRTLGQIAPAGGVGDGVRSPGGVDALDWNRYHGQSYWASLGIVQPGVPTGPFLETVTHEDAELAWGLPTTGTAVTGYRIRYRPTATPNADWIDIDHTGTDRTATIPNLSADTSYEWEIRAMNEAGASNWVSGGPFTTEEAPVEE